MAVITAPPAPPLHGYGGAPVAGKPAPKRPLPAGLKWSTVWKAGKTGFVEGTREVPVNGDWQLTGDLWVCPHLIKDDCRTEVWWFIEGEQPQPRCCPNHPVELVKADVDKTDPALVDNARTRVAGRLRQSIIDRRQKALADATARVEEARKAVEDAARRTLADLRGHRPSVAATLGGLGGAVYLRVTEGPLLAGVVGLLVATAGTLLTYPASHAILYYRHKRAEKNRDQLAGKKATRRLRSEARQIAAGVFALGVWTFAVAWAGVSPATIPGVAALLLGVAAAWVVNRRHWEKLWADRRRLRELARLAAEEAARRAQEEADRLASGKPAQVEVVEEDTALAAGRRAAFNWDRIAQSADVPSGFQMRRTRIVPEETREVLIPGPDGDPIRIGFEFSGVCEPGALVARAGMQPPLLAAANWLASMHERDTSTMALIDRPEDDEGNPRPNRFLLLLTDRAPLGAGVPWKGRAGVRVTPGGTIYVHGGRTLTGENVEEILYSPGSPFGGLTVGHTGAGKTAGQRLEFLNCLAAGVFPVLDDPKNLVDYGDFIGVFPIGVTTEHSHVIVRSLVAERKRREQHLATRPTIDRHGRVRPAEAVWTLNDGPPILGVFEEFHIRAADPMFTGPLTTHVRLQRVAGMGVKAVTQGGGLADLKESVLRGLLAQTQLRLYRTTDASAGLAGYRGGYLVSSLPRVPGVCLVVSEEAPPVPLRAAYVSRDVDDDNSVYDQLYAPDMTPLLTAPTLPQETIDVFRREGLMDLWELGKGPNGLANLMSDSTTNYAPVGPSGELTVVGRMEAADVLLAIILTTPGCARATFQSHPAWTTAPGWGKPPAALSTLSRAVTKLTKDGLITHADNTNYRITDRGMEAATTAHRALFGQPEEDQDPATGDDPTTIQQGS